MDHIPILGGLGLASIVAIFWGHTRMLLLRVVSLAIVRMKVHCPADGPLAGYCYRHFRRSPFGLLTYSGRVIFVRPLDRQQHIALEDIGREPMLFWNGWRPMMMSKMPGNNKDNISEGQNVTITFLRGTFDPDTLMLAAMDEYNAIAGTGSGRKRYMVNKYVGHVGDKEGNSRLSGASTSPDSSGPDNLADHRILRWTLDDLGQKVVAGNALDMLALPPKGEDLVQEIRYWLDSEEFYRERGIPWRRGWLLHGKPGTGKTSLVRAIAQDLDLPVHVFDLSTMSNGEFTGYWRDALSSAPCIALFEDIDAVFEGRTNVAAKPGYGLTFDCFLNALSGIEIADGVFVVITTNRVETLDEALGVPRENSLANATNLISTRPGRIDRTLELGNMNEHCRRKLATRILSQCPQYVERQVRDGAGDTAAQFQERCAQVALTDHWATIEERRTIQALQRAA